MPTHAARCTCASSSEVEAPSHSSKWMGTAALTAVATVGALGQRGAARTQADRSSSLQASPASCGVHAPTIYAPWQL